MQVVPFSGNRKRQVWSVLAATIMMMTAATAAAPVAQAIPGTITTLTLSAPSVPAGTPVTLTAVVTDGDEPLTVGHITFCDSTAAFCGGTGLIGTAEITQAGMSATITVIPAIGTHSYKAVFSATTLNPSSASAPQTLIVTGLYPTTTAISSVGTPGNYTLTGTVVGMGSSSLSPTGSVSFVDTTNANYVPASATLGAAILAQGFLASVSHPSIGLSVQGVFVADLNGDGKPDIVAVNNTSNNVGVMLGNGDGTFQAMQTYATGNGPRMVAIADFNHDGKPDLAVTNSTDGTVTILLGNGDGTFTFEATLTVGSTPIGITAGDFNGDGFPDLAVANFTGSTVSILLGNGDGTFQAQVPFSSSAGNPIMVVAADLNGDGVLDLAVDNALGNEIGISLGNVAGNVGDGTFATQVTYPAGNNTNSLAVADLNNDGVPDIVATNQTDSTVSVLIGNGDGTFKGVVPYATATTPTSVTIADFNGDGFPDLVVINNDAAVQLYLGAGDGTFPTAPINFAGGTNGRMVAAADFNGDGLPDIAVADGSMNDVLVLMNSDTQTATAVATAVSIPGSGSQHLIDASYAGDANFAASTSSTISLTSAPATTALTLTANPASSTYGQSVTLTATLTPSTDGNLTTVGETVTFKNGASTIGTGTLSALGVATLTLTALPAGTDSLTAVYPGDTNYAASTSSAVSFVVTPAVLTVTANPFSRAYGAANPAFTYAMTGFVNGENQGTATTGAPSLTTTATAASPAGGYPIIAAMGSLTAANYTFTFVNSTLTVTQGVLTVTANALTKTYGAANPALTYTMTGFVNGDTQATATAGAPVLTTTALMSSVPASYPITVTVGTLTSMNYTFTFVNSTLTVNQAVLTVTANPLTKAYGAANPALTYTMTGFVNGDTQATATAGAPVLTTTALASSVPGAYPITASAGTLTSANYTFTFVNSTLTINQGVLTVTANALSKTYGAANPPLTYTMAGFVNGDTQATATGGAPTLTTTATAASVVGGYPITVTLGTLTSTNYTFTFTNSTLTVNQAVLTVTANALTKAYGAANPALTYTMAGFVNGDTQATATTGAPTLTTTALASSVPGSYPITATLGTLTSANYTFTFVNSTLTVNQAALTVTANALTKAYGAVNPALTYTMAGFVNGDTQATATTGAPSLTTTALASSVPGSYPITPTLGTLVSTNYTFTFVNSTLTVNQAVLTVTANALTKAYGAANPALTYTMAGFVNGDTQATATAGGPVLTTTALATSVPGSYPITATLGTLTSANYTFTFVNSTLTVNQAVLSVTANALTKAYGAANPALTYTMAGFVNGDTQATATAGAPVLTTTALATSIPGSYPITATVGTLTSANYTFTFVNSTLTVNQAVLTVTASALTKAYGAANPALTYTMAGFVNGDTQATATTGAPSLATTATTASLVGSYPITATVGTLTSANYTFTFVNSTLTVNQAALTVTANALTKAYGAANPPLTYAMAGFVNGDTQATATTGAPSLMTTALATSVPGSYPITAAAGTLMSMNYTFTFVNSTLTVNQAALTVTANALTKAYGAANPALTYTMAGFVNGDTQATATAGAPTLTTTALASSIPGSYPITAALGTLTSANYTFTFVNSTLTVNQAALTVTANALTKAYGAAVPPLTYTMAGFVNGDTQATATTGAPSLTTTATAASAVGSYPITAAVGTLTSTNYTFTFVNGALTVTQAMLTVTGNNLSKTYGAANPALTYTMAGFLNGDTQATATTGVPSLTTTAVASSPLGSYPITVAAGTLASTNYTFTFANGALTVTQAVLTVTGSNLSKAYDTANPALTYAITGFVNGDTQASATTGAPILTTTAVMTSPVGSYPITTVDGTLAATNYTFTFVNGALTVTQGVLTVTANSLSRAFGAANPAFTYTITGFLNGDTQGSATTGAPSLTTTAITTSPVGSYPIAAAVGTLTAANYSFAFVNGVLSVTQITTVTVLTSTATPSAKGTAAVFTATVTSVGGIPVGTVSFLDGVTTLGTGVVNGAGVAVFSTSTLAEGPHSITAVFATGVNFLTSTSSALVFNVVDFSVSSPTGPQTVPAGQAAVFTIATASVGGTYPNPVTITTTALPPGVTAIFAPPSVLPGASTTMTLTTTPRPGTHNMGQLFGPSGSIFPASPLMWFGYLALAMALSTLCFVGFGRKSARRLAPAVALLFLIVTTANLVGCAGGFPVAPGTPAGTYLITVSGGSGTDSHSTTVTLIVQ